MTAQEMLDTTSLNWGVRNEKLVTESGIIVPKKIALVREDNNDILGIHGDGYAAFQNHELMELLHKINLSTGLELKGSGSFGGGARVFIQLKSDDLKLGADRIEGFLTGINSHDGSTSLAFGNSNVTISCQNSFWKSFKQVQTKMKHTVNMKFKIEEILRSVDILLKEEKETFAKIVKMSEMQIHPQLIDLVKQKLFDLDKEEKLDDISTRKQNQIIRFDMDLKTEMDGKGDNLWGLFSGVTRYTTHSASKESEKNQENKMFGRIGNTERMLFHQFAEMV